MLYHQMLREKEVLDKREKTILERLQTYPAGKLIYSQMVNTRNGIYLVMERKFIFPAIKKTPLSLWRKRNIMK